MAVSPHNSLRSNKAKSGIPFVDSSNHTSTKQKQKQKHHAHLRSSSASSSLRKSPPTCTLSLASVSAGPALSLPFPVAIPLPLSAPSSGVPFPSDDGNDAGSCGDAGGPLPEPWRRPRARTSHVETPRRAQPPPKPRRISKPLGASSSPGVSTSTPRPTPTPADLRLAALVERSIAHRLADAHSPLDELDVQDALLAVRLRAFLALHGRRVRPASPQHRALRLRPPRARHRCCSQAVPALTPSSPSFRLRLQRPRQPPPLHPCLRSCALRFSREHQQRYGAEHARARRDVVDSAARGPARGHFYFPAAWAATIVRESDAISACCLAAGRTCSSHHELSLHSGASSRRLFFFFLWPILRIVASVAGALPELWA
ncbi:hypothetical protein B0H13DRAFT_2332137 [Mycena leptocephala]|nr:hypothetical protein B0H13DRAFT_2332137 [Mycena leptocephala]